MNSTNGKLYFFNVGIEAVRCNIVQTYAGILAPVVALPSVMLAHAISRRLGDLDLRGVGIVHRSAVKWEDFIENKNGFVSTVLLKRRGQCLFGACDSRDGKHPQSNSIMPEALADIEVKLMLVCGRDVEPQDVEDVVLSMRLAGGRIARVDVARFENPTDAARNALRGGYLVDDVTPLMAGADGNDGPVDPALALFETLAERSSPWMAPANLGYALLENPQTNRAGTRDGYPHAFCEPMIGLVRFVSSRQILEDVMESRLSFEQLLWRQHWIGDERDQFIVTNHPEAYPCLAQSTTTTTTTTTSEE